MKALIVEDDQFHGTYLQDALAEALPEVTEIFQATDGAAGEEEARQGGIEAIVMDLHANFLSISARLYADCWRGGICCFQRLDCIAHNIHHHLLYFDLSHQNFRQLIRNIDVKGNSRLGQLTRKYLMHLRDHISKLGLDEFHIGVLKQASHASDNLACPYIIIYDIGEDLSDLVDRYWIKRKHSLARLRIAKNRGKWLIQFMRQA